MSVYRFRVSFEDNEEIYREIEIKSLQNFEDFHTIILSSIGFDNKHQASFFISDDYWRKGDEITLKPVDDEDNKKRKREELVFHYYGKSHSAIRSGDFKLIKFWDLKKIELYNLKEDLGELNDLSLKQPQKAKELESKLMAYLKEVNAEILDPSKYPKVKSKEKGSED